MTNENKLKIVTLSHNIKALCYTLDKITLSEHCIASGTLTEIVSQSRSTSFSFNSHINPLLC